MKISLFFILFYSVFSYAQELQNSIEVINIVENGTLMPVPDNLQENECEDETAVAGEDDIIFTEDDIQLTPYL
jgi:hypothetical protein